MLKKTIIILITILFSIPAYSQIEVGVKAGMNLNDIYKDYTKGKYFVPKKSLGFHVGATFNYDFNKSLGIKSSLLYTSKGYGINLNKMKGEETKKIKGYNKVIFNYIEMPLNITYKLYNFRFYGGPFVALGVGGNHYYNYAHYTNDGKRTSFRGSKELTPVFKGTSSKNEFKAFDYGFNVNLGYRINRILFNAGYSFGLKNTTAKNEIFSNPKNFIIKNRTFTFSVSYFLIKND